MKFIRDIVGSILLAVLFYGYLLLLIKWFEGLPIWGSILSFLVAVIIAYQGGTYVALKIFDVMVWIRPKLIKIRYSLQFLIFLITSLALYSIWASDFLSLINSILFTAIILVLSIDVEIARRTVSAEEYFKTEVEGGSEMIDEM